MHPAAICGSHPAADVLKDLLGSVPCIAATREHVRINAALFISIVIEVEATTSSCPAPGRCRKLMVMFPDCGSTFCAVPPLSSVTAAVVRTSALVSGERANSWPNRFPITLHQQQRCTKVAQCSRSMEVFCRS
jgi:hypothetical protein